MREVKMPKRVQVGRRWYSVQFVDDKSVNAGEVHHTTQTIKLSRRSYRGALLSQAAIEETFWHELVHAILHSMNETRLNNNESFVETFSTRLAKAIQSARF